EDAPKPTFHFTKRLLYAIGADSLESEIQPPVGLFTTENRIEWSLHYTLLSSASPENKANLDTISSALFAICLDDHSTIANTNHSHHQFLHNSNGKNRWFDKPLQLILASSGRAGINAEVSVVDPSVYIKLAEYLAANEFPITEKQHPSSSTSNNQDLLFASPEKLTWTLPDTLQPSLESTLQKSTALASSTESVLLETDIYGSRYISQVAKTPQVDAFLQIALAVSWNRLHKTNTLISGTTTGAATGNGENFVTGIRGGQELWEFVESFDNDDVLYDDKRVKFRAAVEALAEQPVDLVAESHVSALVAAVEGNVEREEVEGLFSGAMLGATKAAGKKVGLDVVDVGSAVTSSNGGSFYAGFAAQAWASGYGVAYSVGLDNVKVSVSNKKGGKTNAYRFTDALKRTLVDIMILFPKRSEVWGYDWKEKFARKRKEEYYLKTMKKLSDGYLVQKESLAKKYAGQLKK
ncbi:UNVERIFIED_CONTAM: Carnitine O-acetyltransferase mitochondrial, partial [Siphonaria sp. JEL0065]